MDRETWRASTVHGSQKVRHDLATAAAAARS